MRTQPRQYVAFTIACPITAQVMIAVSGIERLLGRQRYKNRFKFAIEGSAMLALSFSLVITFE